MDGNILRFSDFCRNESNEDMKPQENLNWFNQKDIKQGYKFSSI